LCCFFRCDLFLDLDVPFLPERGNSENYWDGEWAENGIESGQTVNWNL